MSLADPLRKQFSTWRDSEFRPHVLGASLIAGLTIYLLEVIFVISFGALIFSGPLASQLAQALGFITVFVALGLHVDGNADPVHPLATPP